MTEFKHPVFKLPTSKPKGQQKEGITILSKIVGMYGARDIEFNGKVLSLMPKGNDKVMLGWKMVYDCWLSGPVPGYYYLFTENSIFLFYCVILRSFIWYNTELEEALYKKLYKD